MFNLNPTIWLEQNQIYFRNSEIDLHDFMKESDIPIYGTSTGYESFLELNWYTYLGKDIREKLISLCLDKGNMDNTVQFNFLKELLSGQFIEFSFFFEKLPTNYSEDISSFLEELPTKYSEEISSLKEITFNGRSLLDFYTMSNLNTLAIMACNKTIKEIINKTNFTDKYPCLGNQIKENFSKGSERNKHLTTARNTLYEYNKNRDELKLPKEIIQKILENLDKESLKNVTQVASLFFKHKPSTPIYDHEPTKVEAKRLPL